MIQLKTFYDIDKANEWLKAHPKVAVIDIKTTPLFPDTASKGKDYDEYFMCYNDDTYIAYTIIYSEKGALNHFQSTMGAP